MVLAIALVACSSTTEQGTRRAPRSDRPRRARRARRSVPMTIIDSQVHAYEANTPKRPWHSVPNWPEHVTGDEMVAAMDKLGIHGATYTSPSATYRHDGRY